MSVFLATWTKDNSWCVWLVDSCHEMLSEVNLFWMSFSLDIRANSSRCVIWFMLNVSLASWLWVQNFYGLTLTPRIACYPPFRCFGVAVAIGQCRLGLRCYRLAGSSGESHIYFCRVILSCFQTDCYIVSDVFAPLLQISGMLPTIKKVQRNRIPLLTPMLWPERHKGKIGRSQGSEQSLSLW